MFKSLRIALVFTFAITLLTGCGKSPGPLEGTWKTNGPMSLKIEFRSGETESLGIIEHVEYKIEGNTVTVTYKDGPDEGLRHAIHNAES